MAEASKPASFTESQEFKDAVLKAAQEAAKEAVTAALALAREQGGAPPNPGDTSWVQALAMAIAQASNQGVGSKMRAPVPPDVLKKRDAARKQMFDLLIEARAKGILPAYQVKSKTLLDNVLVEPFHINASHIAEPTEIDWPGVPNEVMIPINEAAKLIHRAFEESIGVMIADDAQAVAASRKQFENPRQGLVIKTSPGIKERRVSGNETPSDDLTLLTGLHLRKHGEPGQYKDVNILGTIAQPAQQSV